MALTLTDLKDAATYVVGEEHDPRFDLTRIINSAGHFLFGMHSWRWRERPVATLSFTKDQAYVSLPSDFGWGELTKLTMSDQSSYIDPQPTTLGEIEWMRQQWEMHTPYYYWYALAYPTQTSTSAAPAVPRLEVYPTPDANDADAMKLNYRAGWVELSSNSNVANVPAFMENYLLRLVRAYASQAAGVDPPDKNDQLEVVLDSEELWTLKRMDGAAQANLGDVTGGMLQDGRFGGYNWDFSTSNPND